MADIMDKTDEFFTALANAGIELSGGQTAIVCNDGVVMVSVDDDEGCDVIVCNNRVDFNYSLGITNEDVEHFRTVAGIAVEMEDE